MHANLKYKIQNTHNTIQPHNHTPKHDHDHTSVPNRLLLLLRFQHQKADTNDEIFP